MPHGGGPETPLLPFFCLSVDLEDQRGGTGKEDTLNSPSLDVAITRHSEVERLSPCQEVTWHSGKVLTKCVVTMVFWWPIQIFKTNGQLSLVVLCCGFRPEMTTSGVSCAVETVFATQRIVSETDLSLSGVNPECLE